MCQDASVITAAGLVKTSTQKQTSNKNTDTSFYSFTCKVRFHLSLTVWVWQAESECDVVFWWSAVKSTSERSQVISSPIRVRVRPAGGSLEKLLRPLREFWEWWQLLLTAVCDWWSVSTADSWDKGRGVDQVELIHPVSPLLPPRPCRPPRPPRPPRWFWDQQGHDEELKPGFSSEVKHRGSFQIEQLFSLTSIYNLYVIIWIILGI